MSSSTLLRHLTILLIGVSTFCLVTFLRSFPAVPIPRHGYRGKHRHQSLSQNIVFAIIEPTLRYLGGLVSRLHSQRYREILTLKLKQADDPFGLLPDELLALSLIASISLSGITYWIARNTDTSPSIVLPAALLGLYLPILQTEELIKRRVQSISKTLPHTIEIMAMCLAAGLDFPGAIRLLVTDKTAQTPLGRELSLILESLQLGNTRKLALEEFAERVPSTAVRDFVAAIVQAEQKGNPLAQAILIQGRLLNQRRSVLAEEAAARASVMLIAPMFLLVATVMLLLLGPFICTGAGF